MVTGGGSQLEGIDDLVQEVFRLPARTGRPASWSGRREEDPCCSTVAGAVALVLGDDGGLLEECTGTIIGEVEGLRRLVDEFSRFARMPSLAPRPTDLGRLVEGVAALFAEAHPGVAVRTDAAADLPVLEADGEQLKRALLNLLDNAAAAGAREVRLEAGTDPQTIFEALAGRLRVKKFEIVAPTLHNIFIEKVGGAPMPALEKVGDA